MGKEVHPTTRGSDSSRRDLEACHGTSMGFSARARQVSSMFVPVLVLVWTQTTPSQLFVLRRDEYEDLGEDCLHGKRTRVRRTEYGVQRACI